MDDIVSKFKTQGELRFQFLSKVKKNLCVTDCRPSGERNLVSPPGTGLVLFRPSTDCMRFTHTDFTVHLIQGPQESWPRQIHAKANCHTPDLSSPGFIGHNRVMCLLLNTDKGKCGVQMPQAIMINQSPVHRTQGSHTQPPLLP